MDGCLAGKMAKCFEGRAMLSPCSYIYFLDQCLKYSDTRKDQQANDPPDICLSRGALPVAGLLYECRGWCLNKSTKFTQTNATVQGRYSS
jgi:hypothetical protein